MKLIDGDRLKRKVQRIATEAWMMKLTASVETTLNQFIDYIDEAPAIDIDRPQGEWIYGEHNVAMCDGYRCDRCGFFVPWDYEHKSIDFIKDYKFCPSCGARMKGAINGEDIQGADE